MAVNQQEKRRALARGLAAKSAALMDVIRGLEDLNQQYSGAGLAFADADFEGIAGLQHLDAASASNLLGSIVAVGKFVRGDETAITGSHITNFEKARP
jgi:hypothetical protein